MRLVGILIFVTDEEIKAQVFISSGQRSDLGEVAIAQDIEDELQNLGYETYVAITEQSALGVRENIFRQLERSEYFVFIDFKREPLADEEVCRGSLFSHQELAIASYLKKNLLVFQEKGIKKRDGLIGHLHINSIEFTDRKELPKQVATEVINPDRKWNPRWKDTLVLESANRGKDATIVEIGKNATYFHITVKNLNQNRLARNCYAYLERVVRVPQGTEISVPPIELTWAGYKFPNVVIVASYPRPFDAFYILRDEKPIRIMFQTFSTSTNFVPEPLGQGDYYLTYLVVSENFPPARQIFRLHVPDRLDDIWIKPISDVRNDRFDV